MHFANFDIARAYAEGKVIGWGERLQPGLAKAAFELCASRGAFRPFRITGRTDATAGKKVWLWHVTRKVLGKDTAHYPQEIGDCVSFGAKNAIEYLQACERLLKGERQKWRAVFPPYLYGTGRTYIGRGQLGNSDGSLGSWMAEAVQQYGVLFADEPNVPAYSGRIAKAWGDPNPRNDLDQFKPTAMNFPVKGAALIRTWDDFVAAITNGYPCTTASNVGYDMEAGRDGFHRQRGNWAHQMAFIGVDDNDRDPYAAMLNNWGDVHGHLKDFETGEAWPVGILRVRRADVEKHLRAEETFAFSSFEGFPERRLDKALFYVG
jgi:hypothetical protein